MLTHKINTAFFTVSLLLLVALSQITEVRWYWFIALFLLWFIITGAGSLLIGMQYHMKAHLRSNDHTTRQVALTFDDGPTPFTPRVLDILAANQVKATFFCIGQQIEKHPEILQRIVDEGHIVGNHSFTHSEKIGFFSRDEIIAEIASTDKLIAKIIGKKTSCYRPPFGATSPSIARALKATRHAVIGWNIRSLDTKISSEQKILSRIMNRLSPGSIILLHDTSDKTVSVLEQLLVILRNKNYSAVTIEQLLKINAYEN